MIADKNTQKMLVTVTYEYEADVFEDEDDMYLLAKQEEKFLESEFTALINDDISPATNINVTVKPELT